MAHRACKAHNVSEAHSCAFCWASFVQPPPCLPVYLLLAPQKGMQAAVDALLGGAPRRSALLCDSSKEGEDGG